MRSCSAGENARARASVVPTRQVSPEDAKIIAMMTNW
jgi:hypothetical protein